MVEIEEWSLGRAGTELIKDFSEFEREYISGEALHPALQRHKTVTASKSFSTRLRCTHPECSSATSQGVNECSLNLNLSPNKAHLNLWKYW
jgi:hypothetical protein